MAKKKNKSKAPQRTPSLLGVAARLQKQLEREARKRANKRAKGEAKLKAKFAKYPPNICISIQWGKSMLKEEDDILDLPSRMSLHNLCGNNIPTPPSTTTTPPTTTPPPSTTTTPPLMFDPTFENDEDIKYRLMAEWFNAKKNEEKDPKSRHRVHNHTHWKYIGTKHAPEIHKSSVKEYFDFGLGVFDKLKKTLHDALRTSVGYRFGRIGSQFLDVDEFIRKLHAVGMYPTIHASEKKRSMKPRKQLKGKYQTLQEIRLYFDPTDMDTYIYSPVHPKGTLQGKYDKDADMYLV